MDKNVCHSPFSQVGISFLFQLAEVSSALCIRDPCSGKGTDTAGRRGEAAIHRYTYMHKY